MGGRGVNDGLGRLQCRWIHGCLGDPIIEKVAQLGDGGELLIMDGSGGIFDSAKEELERMDDAVAFGDCWLGEVPV